MVSGTEKGTENIKGKPLRLAFSSIRDYQQARILAASAASATAFRFGVALEA